MLGPIKYFIKLISIPIFYFGSFITAYMTVFKEAKWGLLLLVFLLPQPNIFYKFHGLPFGKDIIDILFFAVLFGIMVQRKGFDRGFNTKLIVFFVIVYYIALWNSTLRFSLPLPLTTANELLRDWKNFALMAFLYLLVVNVVKDEDDQKTFTLLISVVILFISIRCFRDFTAGDSFRWDKRVNGPFEVVGLGSNHLGAFIADYCSVILGLLLFDKNLKRRCLYISTVLFGLHPLFFSYSRGAYIAYLGSISFFGLMKKRSLLVLVIVLLLTWQTVLPVSVVDRIMMTRNEQGEIENSAAGRIELWEFAIKLFDTNPIFGVGYGGYALSVGGLELSSGAVVQAGFDSHNFWVKILGEQGIIGATLFSLIIWRAFRSGFVLYRLANTDFHRGLGFGFMGCVIALAISNLFGDRWSYLSLGAYFWILWGLVDSAIRSTKNEDATNTMPKVA